MRLYYQLYLHGEHLAINFFMEPSIMSLPNFRAENNVLKKVWAQKALLQEKIF